MNHAYTANTGVCSLVCGLGPTRSTPLSSSVAYFPHADPSLQLPQAWASDSKSSRTFGRAFHTASVCILSDRYRDLVDALALLFLRTIGGVHSRRLKMRALELYEAFKAHL